MLPGGALPSDDFTNALILRFQIRQYAAFLVNGHPYIDNPRFFFLFFPLIFIFSKPAMASQKPPQRLDALESMVNDVVGRTRGSYITQHDA